MPNDTSRQFLLAGLVLAVLLTACDQRADESEARHKLLPSVGFVADAARGEARFDVYCARCHGAGARGGRQGPPLVNAIYRPAHHADLAFYWAVRDGVRQHHWQFGDMPAIAGLSAEDVADIIAYVRGEQRKQGIQ